MDYIGSSCLGIVLGAQISICWKILESIGGKEARQAQRRSGAPFPTRSSFHHHNIDEITLSVGSMGIHTWAFFGLRISQAF